MAKEKQSKDKIHPLEAVIFEIVDKAIKETQTKLSKDEVSDIVKALLPDLDELISKKIKKHFLEIGEYIVQKFKS